MSQCAPVHPGAKHTDTHTHTHTRARGASSALSHVKLHTSQAHVLNHTHVIKAACFHIVLYENILFGTNLNIDIALCDNTTSFTSSSPPKYRLKIKCVFLHH